MCMFTMARVVSFDKLGFPYLRVSFSCRGKAWFVGGMEPDPLAWLVGNNKTIFQRILAVPLWVSFQKVMWPDANIISLAE